MTGKERMVLSQGSWLVYLLLGLLILALVAVAYFAMADPAQAAQAFVIANDCKVLDLGGDGVLDVVACPEAVFSLVPFGGG